MRRKFVVQMLIDSTIPGSCRHGFRLKRKEKRFIKGFVAG